MSDNDEKLQNFLTVTGADSERGRFYMESAAWDLEVRNFLYKIKFVALFLTTKSYIVIKKSKGRNNF